MEKEKMSITKALVELKLLDKRINKHITNAVFIELARGKDAKVTLSGKSIEDTKKEIQSVQKSILALISRRNVLKNAITQSNAVTKVKINDKEYTVAETIDRKNSIEYEKRLLKEMMEQYADVVQNMETRNQKMEMNLQNLLEQLQSSEHKDTVTIETTTKTYRELNESFLVDPIGLQKTIEELNEVIDRYEADVDLILSEVNAITLIEV